MNKLGFYLQRSKVEMPAVGDVLFAAFQQVRPPVLLVHADGINSDLLRLNRKTGGVNAFVVGRLFKELGQQEAMLRSSDPAAAGRNMADEILQKDPFLYLARGENGRLLIDAWMSLNEPIPGPAWNHFQEHAADLIQRYQAYDAFQVAFRTRLQEKGLEAVAFNFGAGNFAQPEHYLTHFPQTLASYQYLGFHEYAWPHMNPQAPDPQEPTRLTASSAGFYRRCMAGIRQQYGPRHQVIITEAGLTREHNHDRDHLHLHPQDQARKETLREETRGWLCFTEPLSQEYYFSSLKWYNQFLAQDDFVIGACLYQIGHSDSFISHRHLGKDEQGNKLLLIDWLAQLANAPSSAPLSIATTAPQVRILRGRVKANGAEVAGAVVQLFGAMTALGACRQAVLALPPTALRWDRTLQGVEGDRWRCYQKYVAQEVAGLDYAAFKDQVVAHNPSLASSNYEFLPHEIYTLPRNQSEAAATQWDRTISGFAGNRWSCWQKFVAGRVLGLNWSEFNAQVMAHNPELSADDGNFVEHKHYRLPQNPAYQEVILTELTDADGCFVYTDLPVGRYRLVVHAAGYEPLERTLDLTQETDLTLVLQQQQGSAMPAFQSITPPMIRAHEGRFFLGDQLLPRFAGVNLPLLLHLDDHNLTKPNDLSLEQYLDQTKALGATVVRVFVPHHSLSNAEMARRLQTVLPAFAARKLYLLPVLIDLYSNSGAYPKAMEPYLVDFHDGDPSRRLGPGFFTEGYKTPEYQAYLRAIVEAVPPAFRHTIFAWEIGNELKMEHPGANPPSTKWGDPAQFVQFNREMATMIKQMDQQQHPVTTGMISTQHVYLKDQPTLIRQLYDHAAIDFLTVHVYYNKQNGPLEQAQPNNEPDTDAVLAHLFRKPIIVEEAGIDKENDDFAARLAADLRRWFHQSHWQGQERQRAAGYMIWRPPFGLMGSGDVHKSGDVLQPQLSVLPSMGPVLAEANGHGVDHFIHQPPAQPSATPDKRNKIGLDLNQPIFGRQPSEIASKPHLIAQTGAGWVRLNFVLEAANSPTDPEWLATYGRIIDNYRAAGLQIYGLIGGQAVRTHIEHRLLHSVQMTTENGSRAEAEAWLDEYADNFFKIVQAFGDRITYFESYNEPNNWAKGLTVPVIEPTWFAHLLQRVYQRVKPAFPNHQLISGPLLASFHHQPTGQSAAAYLNNVYKEGRRLGWHAARTFPFDGIGYHLYLKPNQQTDFAIGAEHAAPMSWAQHGEMVSNYYNTFNDALLKVARDHDVPAQRQRLFISEMGWDSADNSEAWLAFQARSVDLALTLLTDDPRVELGFWFCTRDFPGEHKGLFRATAPLEQAGKPALAVFQDFCRRRFGSTQPGGEPSSPLNGAAAPLFCAMPQTPAPLIRAGLHREQAHAVLMLRKKWVNSTVLHYYFFDQLTDGSLLPTDNGSQWVSWVGTEAQKAIVRQAFQHWKEVGIGLEFKEVTVRSEAEIRIGFQRGAGHWSYVGRDCIDLVPLSNDRTMNFDWRPGSLEQLDTALHEIGHALGLEHEHQNPAGGIVWDEEAVYRYFAAPPNRWDKETIDFNILRKITADEVQGSRWDPTSIMHYAFAPGLIKVPEAYTQGLTPGSGLSPHDCAWALTFYPTAEEAVEPLLPFASKPLSLHTGKQKDFIITPTATRTYTFSTFGESDVVMVLFEEINGESRYVTAEDDSALESNAQFQTRLFAGRRYILRVRLYYSVGAPEAAVMYW